MGDADPWNRLFAPGCPDGKPEDNELVPYWLYTAGAKRGSSATYVAAPQPGHRALRRARRALAAYRTAFGQSRQNDLVAYLLEHLDMAQIEALMDDARLDLAPRVADDRADHLRVA